MKKGKLKFEYVYSVNGVAIYLNGEYFCTQVMSAFILDYVRHRFVYHKNDVEAEHRFIGFKPDVVDTLTKDVDEFIRLWEEDLGSKRW